MKSGTATRAVCYISLFKTKHMHTHTVNTNTYVAYNAMKTLLLQTVLLLSVKAVCSFLLNLEFLLVRLIPLLMRNLGASGSERTQFNSYSATYFASLPPLFWVI